MIGRLATRAIRPMSTKTELTTPLSQRLVTAKKAMWVAKKSDPIAGFSMIGILSGTMVLCIVPGILAALEPAAEHGDH